MNTLTGKILTLPKMSGSVSTPNSLIGNVGAKTIYIGGKGDDGATFIPYVSADGIISWTNDKDLPNPEPVNIKGEKGDKGDRGEQGIQGEKGDKGDKGDKGADGTMTFEDLTAEQKASLKGDKGDKGDPGTNGKDGYTPVKGVDYFDGQPGKDGADGKDGARGARGEKGEPGTPGEPGEPGEPGYTPVKGVDYYTEADKQDMAAAVLELVNDDLDSIRSDIADLKYVAIDITKFSHSAGTVEMGGTVKELTLSWTLNKTPASQTVNGESLDVSVRSKKLTGLNITANKSFSMSVTDERGATDSASTTVSFQNGVYYGAGSNPATLDSAFILALASKTLSSAKGRTIDVTAGDGQHIWYALPKRLGTCKFTVGGFEGGFDLVATIDFTNSKGYTEPYYIYRSGQTGLGATKVVIS